MKFHLERFPLGWAICDQLGRNVTGNVNTPTIWPFYFSEEQATLELDARNKEDTV